MERDAEGGQTAIFADGALFDGVELLRGGQHGQVIGETCVVATARLLDRAFKNDTPTGQRLEQFTLPGFITHQRLHLPGGLQEILGEGGEAKKLTSMTDRMQEYLRTASDE